MDGRGLVGIHVLIENVRRRENRRQRCEVIVVWWMGKARGQNIFTSQHPIPNASQPQQDTIRSKSI
jgi:hypothetical protein